MCVCVHACIRVHGHACIRVHGHACIRVHRHACIRVHMHACIPVCMCWVEVSGRRGIASFNFVVDWESPLMTCLRVHNCCKPKPAFEIFYLTCFHLKILRLKEACRALKGKGMNAPGEHQRQRLKKMNVKATSRELTFRKLGPVSEF